MFTLTFLLLNIVSIHAGYDLVSSNVHVSLGGSFFNQYYGVQTPQDNISSCTLMYYIDDTNINKLHIPIDVESEKMITGDHMFENRLYSLGRGVCGIRLLDVQLSDEKKRIHLQADINDFLNSKYFMIHAHDRNLANPTYSVALGESFHIALGTDNELKWLYDPTGVLVDETEDKEYEISVIRLEHIGRWTVRTFDMFNTMPFEFHVTLQLKPELTMDSWYKEKMGYGHIGCKLHHFQETQPYCQIVSPENIVYTISQYTATERYTTVGTQLESNEPVCQIEFPLPATDQEIGTWKCVIGDYGSFIDVEQETPDHNSNDQVKYIENNELDISCSVSYLIEACNIESPSGKIFNIVDSKLTKGICSMKMATVELGTWTCRISKRGISENKIIKVHVKSISTEASISYDEDGAKRHHPYNIMCKAASPLSLCWFVSPSGKTYHAMPEKKGKEFLYFGRGLLYGDCGITIIDVNDEHAGEWSCHMQKINADGLVLRADLQVRYDVDFQVKSVGAPIGIALAVLFFIGLIGYGIRKKRQYPQIEDQSEFRMDSTMHISNANNRTNNGTFD